MRKRSILIYYAVLIFTIGALWGLSYLDDRSIDALNSGDADKIMSVFSDNAVIVCKGKSYSFADYRNQISQRINGNKYRITAEEYERHKMRVYYAPENITSYCSLEWNFLRTKIKKISFSAGDKIAEKFFLGAIETQYITKEILSEILCPNVCRGTEYANITSRQLKEFYSIISFDYPWDKINTDNLISQLSSSELTSEPYEWMDPNVLRVIREDGLDKDIYWARTEYYIWFGYDDPDNLYGIKAYVAKQGDMCRVYITFFGVCEYKEL